MPLTIQIKNIVLWSSSEKKKPYTSTSGPAKDWAEIKSRFERFPDNALFRIFGDLSYGPFTKACTLIETPWPIQDPTKLKALKEILDEHGFENDL